MENIDKYIGQYRSQLTMVIIELQLNIEIGGIRALQFCYIMYYIVYTLRKILLYVVN